MGASNIQEVTNLLGQVRHFIHCFALYPMVSVYWVGLGLTDPELHIPAANMCLNIHTGPWESRCEINSPPCFDE